MRVVPGEQPYSRGHRKKVLIVGDSICGGIKRPEFMDELKSRGMDVDVSIRRYTGGQSHELYHHAKQNIADERPHGLILVGGTNDMSQRDGRRQLSDSEIANNLLATGQLARSQGVSKVFISSIIVRKGVHYERRASAINRILRDGCNQYGFIYIDNNNITRGELQDGLHLNDEGTLIFKNNIINRMY